MKLSKNFRKKLAASTSKNPSPLAKANNRKIETFNSNNRTNKATVSNAKLNKIMQTQSRAGIDLPRPQSRMEYLRQRLDSRLPRP